MMLHLCLGLWVLFVGHAMAVDTGFWYDFTRPPVNQYDSLPLANMTVKVVRSILDGPGQNLVSDPYNPGDPLFVGNTINRQTFDTQFVLDMSSSIGISSDRIYVTSVRKTEVHFTDESTAVTVQFLILERNQTSVGGLTLLEAISVLTHQIQNTTSQLYLGNVTKDIDPDWGLQVENWDISLRLTYAIEVIGGEAVQDGYYLNQGGLGLCDFYYGEEHIKYCEWERFFEDDVSEALNISYYRVQILFVKKAALDASLVYFRILPRMNGENETNIVESLGNLLVQVYDKRSELFKGNVTLRVDPLWGISNLFPLQRTTAPLFTKEHYVYSPDALASDSHMRFLTDYDRCKANRRCNRGEVHHNQTTNEVKYYQRLFDEGQLYPADIFLNFEDWKLGTRGFSWEGTSPPTAGGMTQTNASYSNVTDGQIRVQMPSGDVISVDVAVSDSIDGFKLRIEELTGIVAIQQTLIFAGKQLRDGTPLSAYNIVEESTVYLNYSPHGTQGFLRGAHFNPFDFESIGTVFPLYRHEENRGLVLDRQMQREQIDTQQALVDDIAGQIKWLEDNIETAYMDAELRARKDVRQFSNHRLESLRIWLQQETDELNLLNTSQCVETHCVITFNTSSLELYGAVNDTGVVANTTSGTEVAVFAFDSIYLGPEVDIRVVGQRALALVSKSTAVLNTTITAHAGTLGGMQGGISTARLPQDRLSDDPAEIYICDIGGYCNTDRNFTDLITNNVNGPGSPNLLVTPFVLESSAANIPEIQTVQTIADEGQTLSGGFTLRYRELESSLIPHDASPAEFKAIIEADLNIVAVTGIRSQIDRTDAPRAGIGIVEVTRSLVDTTGGYTWTISFLTAVANIEPLTPSNFLGGLGASVTVETTRDGNEITGTFTLSYFGFTTRPIAAAETAAGLEEILAELEPVVTVFIAKDDPSFNCDDGLCPNGPRAARGYRWTGIITTNSSYGNVSPTSPTDELALVEDPPTELIPDISGLSATNLSVDFFFGTTLSEDLTVATLDVPKPFSLAFGGSGASYGGIGGAGYPTSDVPTGPTYNTIEIEDLLGGSGGGQAQDNLFIINSVKGPSIGRGGKGGGAVEIIAANDIVIAEYGKIIARGEDADQASGGGAGGGSGGAVLLSAKGNVFVDGVLDVSGGAGGYGGAGVEDFPGGGGSAGRIAMYAESVIVPGKLLVEGGRCGVYKIPVETSVKIFKIAVHSFSVSTIDEANLAHLSVLFVNDTFTYDDVEVTLVQQNVAADGQEGLVEMNVTMSTSGSSITPDVSVVNATLVARLGAVYAAVIMQNVSVELISETFIYPTYSLDPTSCTNDGGSGTVYREATMTTNMTVVENFGVEGTSRSLLLTNRETTNTTSGSTKEVPFAANGPVIPFPPSQPTRVTYYTRVRSSEVSTFADYGSMFTLVSRGDDGIGEASIIGIFMGYRIMYGSNFVQSVDEQIYLKRLATLWDYPSLDRWYKIDIHIDWDNHTYFILLDDELAVKNAPFQGNYLDGLRLSVHRGIDVYYDEIYLGFDNTMGFTCPETTRKGTNTVAPSRKGWSIEEVRGGFGDMRTVYKDKKRHYNHLDLTGSVAFDGQGMVEHIQDIQNAFPTGDYRTSQGKIHAGALLSTRDARPGSTVFTQASNTLVTKKGLWENPSTGTDAETGVRQYWYSEHSGSSPEISALRGGVAICSTQDFNTWRFEGFAHEYVNVSDMVYGTSGPFAFERPKVLFNPIKNEYAMWAAVDNHNRSLAMAAILTSPYPDGPFVQRRTFYPDGNHTRDLNIFENDENMTVLGRTYYSTVEYLLPEARLQPVWESVKYRNGSINFRNNYHRAWYAKGYDSFHDIYLQRWNLEDRPYDVRCINKITGAERMVPIGQVNEVGDVCNDPEEYKVILGQGNPVVKTVFIDPNNTDNSWWKQHSVPDVQPQPWSKSYRDGFCGIRDLQDDLDVNDPNLANFDPEDRSTCSNIADNPIHVTLQDKLIGVQKVVTSRRTKYIAVSRLTDDYLDTTGALQSIEGELDHGDLISLISKMGQFGFGSGLKTKSTFHPPVRSEYETALDFRHRFKQYIHNHNDRAIYALGCVLDGSCSVNTRDQLTEGHT